MCLGIPAEIVEIVDADAHRAVASVEGVRREINIGLIGEAEGGIAVGDWVLIHVGFAMAKIDEEEAAQTLAFMRELGDEFDDEVAQFGEAAHDA